MDMLRQAADQFRLIQTNDLEAGLIVNMMDTGDQTAGLLPCFVEAAGRMTVIRNLFQRTDLTDLYFIALLIVGMTLRLFQRAGLCLSVAGTVMGMSLPLLFGTNQLAEHFIATIQMGMVIVLSQSADKLHPVLIAIFRMGMSRSFLQSAFQRSFRRTLLAVAMALGFLLGTDQLLLGFLASFTVKMFLKLREFTNEYACLIVANFTVSMQHPFAETASRVIQRSSTAVCMDMRLHCAARHANLRAITSLRMFMGLLTANRFLRQRDRRQHQCIHRTENHDHCQCTDHAFPNAVAFTGLVSHIQFA
jgi:hypothetical protein